MSVLRFARPKQPTILVDLGPAVGRRSFTRYGLRGSSLNGSLVVGESQYSYARRAEREYKARMKVEP